MIVLIVANHFPLLYLFFTGWTAVDILLLYWIENVALCAVTVLKMATCTNTATRARVQMEGLGPVARQSLMRVTSEPNPLFLRLWVGGIFVVVYGAACLIYGAIVLGIAGRIAPGVQAEGNITGLLSGLKLPLAVLLAGHLLTFWREYIGKGEYKTVTLETLFFIPFQRVILMVMVVNLGGIIALGAGNPGIVLTLVILVKTALDVAAQRKERSRANRPPQAEPEP